MNGNQISREMRAAFSQKNLEAITNLLLAGEKVNAYLDPMVGWTMLAAASHECSTEIVRLLLESGANTESVDLEGNTALILATIQGHIEVVELLLQYGADLNHKTRSGWTAARWARNRGHSQIAEILQQFSEN
jgi:ankyrin repeat protein